MKILAIAFFDPASVVLSHRDLMRAAGHDFRLATVRAYTERQRQADWVCEQLAERTLSPRARLLQLERLEPDLESLREFAESADVIQLHPGIGRGDGDWASQRTARPLPPDPMTELDSVLECFGLGSFAFRGRHIAFIHGSNAMAYHLNNYRGWLVPFELAASTIDYAAELDAAYLPPLVDVGDLRARLRGDDDPLLIAHTPTDRAACSTEEFLAAARGLGIPVRLGEGLSHSEVLRLKAECNAGFDHLRGAFSVNTLENAALGLVPLFALKKRYVQSKFYEEGIYPLYVDMELGARVDIEDLDDLRGALRYFGKSPYASQLYQKAARSWWENYFSAAPITQRLLKFYQSL